MGPAHRKRCLCVQYIRGHVLPLDSIAEPDGNATGPILPCVYVIIRSEIYALLTGTAIGLLSLRHLCAEAKLDSKTRDHQSRLYLGIERRERKPVASESIEPKPSTPALTPQNDPFESKPEHELHKDCEKLQINAFSFVINNLKQPSF